MKKMKNNLDEMQEQELLRIEHNGCWLAFWLLLLSLIVQALAFGGKDFKIIAGEWLILMILSLYLAIACVRKGIWDRHLKMDTKTNLVVSLIAGLALTGFNAIFFIKKIHNPAKAVIASLITGIITFVICFIILTIMKSVTRKKQNELEKEPKDE